MISNFDFLFISLLILLSAFSLFVVFAVNLIDMLLEYRYQSLIKKVTFFFAFATGISILVLFGRMFLLLFQSI